MKTLTAIYCPICGIGTGDFSEECLFAFAQMHALMFGHKVLMKMGECHDHDTTGLLEASRHELDA